MLSKLKNIEIEDFCEYDYDSIIRNFWMHSAAMRMSEFDFNGAFEALSQPIRSKLIEHGLMSYDEFRDNEEGLMDMSIFDQLESGTNYFSFTAEDAAEAIFKAKYEVMKDAFEGMGTFEELQDLLDRIDSSDELSEQKKIELFDNIIHAQHETGAIFDDVDMETLHEEVDEEIKELLGLND